LDMTIDATVRCGGRVIRPDGSTVSGLTIFVVLGRPLDRISTATLLELQDKWHIPGIIPFTTDVTAFTTEIIPFTTDVTGFTIGRYPGYPVLTRFRPGVWRSRRTKPGYIDKQLKKRLMKIKSRCVRNIPAIAISSHDVKRVSVDHQQASNENQVINTRSWSTHTFCGC
jgi:hypothetical protein